MAKVSCRKAFTAKLLELARENDKIYAVATDSRGSVTIGKFAEEFPDRFIECGIAEQNAVGVASGLAKDGNNVFVTGPACFLAARAYEQVKVDVAYNKTNVKIVGVSSGVSYGPLGGTHTSLHDYASMRALANMLVLAPSDNIQTEYLTEYLAANHQPTYMRMGRGDVESVYEAGESFEIGKAKQVCDGTDITIIACGEMVIVAKKAAEKLKEQGISARVLDMFTIKPLDVDSVVKAAKETKGIITLEEHSIYGGLGEAVTHVVSEQAPTRVKILGFPDDEIKIGNSKELFEHYGLTPENVAGVAEKLLNR